MVSSTPHVPVTVDMTYPEIGVKKLISQIRPEWPADQLKLKTFTDGITNKLVGCHVGDVNEMVLVRVYGDKTELFIDRAVEMKTMRLLNQHGCAKPLYCTFENGICYGFVAGQVFDDDMMKDKKYAALVAKEMARLHSLPVPESYAPGQTRSSYFIQFHRLLELLPENFSDPVKDKRYQTEVMKKDELKVAADELEAIVTSWQEPLVLCHHDLLIKNLVYSPEEERVYFIDYEYAGMSYPALDIGDHFDEYAGVDNLDFNLYPSREHQFYFLRAYLTELSRLRGDGDFISDQQVETLYKQVNKMALMPHLFWGVWAVVQAYYSSLDFDFLGYAIEKMNEYKKRRDEFLAL